MGVRCSGAKILGEQVGPVPGNTARRRRGRGALTGSRSSGVTRTRGLLLAVVFASSALAIVATPASRADSVERLRASNWVGAWAAAPMNANYPAAINQSFRMILHPTIGGKAVRVRFSNAYGETPLELSSVSIARRTSGPAIDPDTSTAVRFHRRRTVLIPPHGSVVSDPVRLDFAFGDDLAVSFHTPRVVPQVTGHGIVGTGLVTNYATSPNAGDTTADAEGASFSQAVNFSYLVSGLDAYVPGALGTIVAFGDSITTGTYSTVDGNDSYPEMLARRLQRAGIKIGVLNAGIPGNTLLPCFNEAVMGDAGIDRFDRDVLAAPNLRAVILKEGGNDLRFCRVDGEEVAAGLQSLVDRSRAAGVSVVVGSYVPRVSKTVAFEVNQAPDALGDDQRQALNSWIRAHAEDFDGLVDFDAALRDPQTRNYLAATYDSGDGVHPNAAGYAVMADVIPLRMLVRLAR
jgi:lysophospholipase L1-like esterase